MNGTKHCHNMEEDNLFNSPIFHHLHRRSVVQLFWKNLEFFHNVREPHRQFFNEKCK